MSWQFSGIAHCLSSLWPGFNSQPRRSISRDFSLADNTLNPSLASVAENGPISPQLHHTICGQRRGRSKSNHERTMADWKKDIKQDGADRAAFVCSCSADNSFVYQLQSHSWAYTLLSHLFSQCDNKFFNQFNQSLHKNLGVGQNQERNRSGQTA